MYGRNRRAEEEYFAWRALLSMGNMLILLDLAQFLDSQQPLWRIHLPEVIGLFSRGSGYVLYLLRSYS